MRTQPIPEAEGDRLAHFQQVNALAASIGLPGGSIRDLIEAHQDHPALLAKVLGCFQGGFTWQRAFAVLHSDPDKARKMIAQIFAALGQEPPPRPFAESKLV